MRAAAAGALVALALCSTGCGLVTLMHDQVLGPVSPAGRIHDAAVGSRFEATIEGVTADAASEPRFRPYPRDMIRRMGSPSSFRSLTSGVQAFLLGASTYAERRTATGAAPASAAVPPLGAGRDEVLQAIGPPDEWVRFVGGEAMSYRADRERRTILNLGIPPALSAFVPIPAVSNLAYRRIWKESNRDGFVLLFDAGGRLVRVAPAGAR